MRRPLLFLFSIIINGHFSFGQDLNSLSTELKNHPQEDTVRINLILDICSKNYAFVPEENKVYAEEVLRISKKIGYQQGIGFATRYIALYYWAISDYGQATHYAYEMLRIFEDLSMGHNEISS